MRKKLVAVLITLAILVSALSMSVLASNADNLQDVKRGDWYYGVVHYVVDNGLMVGTSDTTFSPNVAVSRAMFIQSIYSLAGSPAVSTVRPVFTDVPQSDWYYNAIVWATENNIITGLDNGAFKPNEPISREQMASVFYRYAIYKGYITEGSTAYCDLSSYPDAGSLDSWAVIPVSWCVNTGVMVGTDDGKLDPQGDSTRAQAATMLASFIDTFVAPQTVDMYQVKSINHRGYNQVAPENTLEAFRLSKQYGFEYVETDVQLTKDRQPVILHDHSINRTARYTDGSQIAQTINISDITLEEARQYDFGIWKGSAYAGTKIPTFEEYVALCKELGLKCYIELKGEAGFTQADVQNLINIVANYGMTDNVTWMSFNADCLKLVAQCKADAPLAYVTTQVNDTVIQTAKSLLNGQNSIFIDSSQRDSTAVALCSAAGIPLETWTLDKEEQIKAVDLYISGITSNCLVATKVLNGWN